MSSVHVVNMNNISNFRISNFRSRVFSGVQPTGALHIGNYLGALSRFVELQKDYFCLYCIADSHAITAGYNPKELASCSKEMTALFIACGVDPDQHIIFNQSQVSAHAELAWILACTARTGWLGRMTQFKEKAAEYRDEVPVGLYLYPVLMAADILLYKTNAVPVGEDQQQHLELTKDIARKFNLDYADRCLELGYGDAEGYFPLPKTLLAEQGVRVMSLRDGTKKMSKSDSSDYSRINLSDTNDMIARKINRAKTDTLPLPSDESGLHGRPEAANLINIYAAFSGKSLEEVLQEFAGCLFSGFKPSLVDLIVGKLEPIRNKVVRISSDEGYTEGVLHQGAERAAEIASEVLKEVKDIVGFLR